MYKKLKYRSLFFQYFRKVTISAACFLILLNAARGQANLLSGIVTVDGSPEKGVTIYTNFATSTSDNLGRFALNLDSCKSCKRGNKIKVYSFKSGVNTGIHDFVIDNYNSLNIELKRFEKNINIIGAAEDSDTKLPLAGIAIKLAISDLDIPVCRTDTAGMFYFKIPQSILSGGRQIPIIAIDESKRYVPMGENPSYCEIGTFCKVFLRSSPYKRVLISDHRKSGFCVQAGDLVHIITGGEMEFINTLGKSGPDGRSEQVIAVPVDSRRMYREFAFGALLYRITGENEWKPAGSEKRFIANVDGCLEFCINDTHLENTRGAYEVMVAIKN